MIFVDLIVGLLAVAVLVLVALLFVKKSSRRAPPSAEDPRKGPTINTPPQ
jgi:hypothetical protein